jgi:small-conductance mechanosensitive channel
MYNWLVLLHILFAFLFMLAHGVQAAVMLKFRGEPDPEKSLTFFNVLPQLTLVRSLTVGMGVFGFAAAFMTPWWKQGWVWASLVIFAIISWVMYKYGSGYYLIIWNAANRLIEAKKTNVDLPVAQTDYDAARNAPNVMIVSIVGVVGLAIILWLMRFKPF